MHKLWGCLFLCQIVGAAENSTAVLSIAGELQPAIMFNLLTSANQDDNTSALASAVQSGGAPSLQTTVNIQVQCVGAVELQAYLSSANDFNLVSVLNPLLRVPYSVYIVNANANSKTNAQSLNKTLSQSSSFSLPCDTKPSIVPLTVKSQILPANYSVGNYQDNMLLIVTY